MQNFILKNKKMYLDQAIFALFGLAGMTYALLEFAYLLGVFDKKRSSEFTYKKIKIKN